MPSIDIGLDPASATLLDEVCDQLRESNRLQTEANMKLGEAIELNTRSKRLLLELVRKIRKASGMEIHVADDS